MKTFPPIQTDLVIDDAGAARTPDDINGSVWMHLHAGVRLGWWPAPSGDGAVLHLLGGPKADEGYEEDAICCHVSREGLSSTIRDLLAILAAVSHPTVVYGPAASGKTRNTAGLMKLFGATTVIDGWDPRDRLPLPTGPVLVLTYESKYVVEKAFQTATIIDIETAKSQLAEMGLLA